MNRQIFPLIAASLALHCATPSRADEAGPQTPPVLARVLKSPPPTFKSTTLQGKVAESIEHAKQGVLGYVLYLMESNKSKPDKVLSYFERYSKDKNDDVKFAVINAASCAHTKKSLGMLSALVPDQDVGHDAVNSLYYGYSKQQLVSGGERLRLALIKNIAGSPYANRAILLLQLFGRQKAPVVLLKRRLHNYKQDSYGFEFEAVCMNLALYELGDAEATSNVAQYFDKQQIDNLLLLMRHLKFIERKAVLRRALSLLNDKSNARRTGLPDGPPEYTRLCDEAMGSSSKQIRA